MAVPWRVAQPGRTDPLAIHDARKGSVVKGHGSTGLYPFKKWDHADSKYINIYIYTHQSNHPTESQ